MNLYKKKVLGFKTSTWFIGDAMFYVARIPGVDFLHIQQTYPFSQYAKNVLISEFIGSHPTYERRQKAAEFVFCELDWHDNICIRSAIEKNLLASYQDNTNPRIVNGEIWTDTDYEIESSVGNFAALDRPFKDYPELPYGVTFLPPYAPFEDLPITRLKRGEISLSNPFEHLLTQLTT